MNYDILVIMSPKYLNPTTSNLKKLEENFLGYSFSNNRNKSGISIIDNSGLNSLIDLTNNFIFSNIKDNQKGKNYKFVKLNDILLNKNRNCVGFIYPKYTKISGKPLNAFCKINVRKESELSSIKGYLEITNLDDQIPVKKKSSKRFCMKGDILISSLCPTAKKIVIAKDNFMVTNAIHVLSHFPNDKTRDAVFKQLKNQVTLIQMNSLLDGFKTTYAKISEENLFNNVLINNNSNQN